MSRDQREQGGGHSPQDQRREVIEVDARKNQLTVAAGANQKASGAVPTLIAVAIRMPESITGQALGNST